MEHERHVSCQVGGASPSTEIPEGEPPQEVKGVNFNDPHDMTTRPLTQEDIHWAKVLVPEARQNLKDAQEAFKAILDKYYPVLMKSNGLNLFPCSFRDTYNLDMDKFDAKGPIAQFIIEKEPDEYDDFHLSRTGFTLRVCGDALKGCEKEEDMLNSPKMPFLEVPMRIENGKEVSDGSSLGPNFFIIGSGYTNMLSMPREMRVNLQQDLEDVYPQLMEKTLFFLAAAADSPFYSDIPQEHKNAIAILKNFMKPEFWEFNPTQQASNGKGLSATSVSLPHGALRPRLKQTVLDTYPELASAWAILMEEAYKNMSSYENQMILLEEVLAAP